MRPHFITGPLLEAAWAFGILIASALLGWLILLLPKYFQHKLAERSKKNALMPPLLESLYRPVFILVIFEGALLALSSVSYLSHWEVGLEKASVVGVMVLITYALSRSGNEFLDWNMRRFSGRRKAKVDEGLIRFLKRMMLLVVYIIGALVVMDYLKIAITPIITGLGIAGLAVALALQPTLANFFASTQIISDRVVRVGDYIELENAEIRGYVIDVGWRSTRVRTPFNNLIVIPNSRLSDSIVTNYFGPTMEMGVSIEGGVSYGSNLAQVEQICRDVANTVVQEMDEADKTFEPWFAFDSFGDSNITFWVWVRAKDRMASFKVKSEIIKRIKAEFDKVDITINYPVRHLEFDKNTAQRLQFMASQENQPDSESA